MNLNDALRLPWWLVLASGMVAVAVYLFQKYFEANLARTQASELTLAERKQELYADFMSKLWGPMTEGGMTPELVTYMQDWARRMIVTASDEVMMKMQAMQQASADGGNYMIAGAELFIAMRRDMGNARTRITARQLLRAIVKVSEWDAVDDMVAGRWRPNPAGAPALPDTGSQTRANTPQTSQLSGTKESSKHRRKRRRR